MPCVAQLNSPADRLAALLAVIAAETEPIVTLTHLLQLCRDEHVVLWERVTDPDCRDQVAATLSRLGDKISASQVNPTLDKATRLLLATSLDSTTGVSPVVVAHASPSFLTIITHTRSRNSSVIAAPTNRRSAIQFRWTFRICER